MGKSHSHEVIREYLQDPATIKLLQEFQQQNAHLLQQFEKLRQEIEDQKIESFEDLQQYDQKGADALVKLATQTTPLQMQGRNIGFFGLTSTGKSTIINKLLDREVAKTGAGETTTKIEPYDGKGYTLYDIPGRNDDTTYFSMEYVAFWKGLTARVVLLTTSMKEMTKVFHLLDAINLKYDIVVNKFDLIKQDERENFKAQIKQEINQCGLKGVNNVWFVSSQNPRQFPDWITMCHSFLDCYPDLELEARQFVFEECSKTDTTFTAETLAIFIDNRFYELNNLKKVDQRLARSVESCKLDLRRFGAKFTANSSRPYFLGHEREDVVKHRKEFVKYFIEREQHFYTITNDAVPQWKTPTTTPAVLLYILSQFKRLFQLLPFKNEYKNHNFVCLLDNARTHTAAHMHINDFGMTPGTRCPVDKIDYIDENNKKQTIECYDDDDEYNKGLLALAYELNVFVLKKYANSMN
ncbi:unnamed protein product [Rotaria socialis]|uniref:G domain-containing protein n=1 Tax=Rotaria socialis TaxID=392032 RepID=A0A817U3U7_9BILA|nr:unnamed protein product [Rotaria socialis]